MRRLAACSLAAALVAAGTPSAAAGQDDPLARRAGLVDLGLYAGGAWSTDWFEVQGEGFNVGLMPAVGAQATYWLSPIAGVRLHGAYLPARLPAGEVGFPEDDWVVNNWLYDVSLVLRPWFGRTNVGQFRGSTYFVAGVGGFTSNTSGAPEPETSLAANVGVGATAVRLTARYALFGELDLYAYPGPVPQTGPARRLTAFTVVGKLGLRREWW